jgi:hypothetical protein
MESWLRATNAGPDMCCGRGTAWQLRIVHLRDHRHPPRHADLVLRHDAPSAHDPMSSEAAWTGKSFMSGLAASATQGQRHEPKGST